MAVSYTHLDVYKRQRLYRCKQDACPGGVQPESLCVQLGVVAHMAAGDHQMGKMCIRDRLKLDLEQVDATLVS